MNNSKVCTSCQFANPHTSKYCIQCGKNLAVTNNIGDRKISKPKEMFKPKEISSEKEIKTSSGSNKNKLFVLIGIAVMICLGFVVFQLSQNGSSEESNTDEQTPEEQLLSVFKEKDIDGIMNYIIFPKGAFYDVEAVERYFEETDLNEIHLRLDEALNNKNYSEGIVIYDPLYEQPLFRILHKEDEIQLEAIARSTKIVSNLPGMTLHIMDKSVSVNEPEVSFEEMVFGIYKAEITGETEIAQVNQKKMITLPNEQGYVLNADVETYIISYSSNIPHINVSFNGYESFTGDGENYPQFIRNIPVGSSVEVYGYFEEDGKTYKSEVYNVSKETELIIEFPEYEKNSIDTYSEMKEPVGEVIGQFLYVYENGLVNELSTVVSRNSALYNSHSDYMNSLKERNIDVTVNEFIIDQIEQIASNEYLVVVEEEYYIKYPDKSPTTVTQRVEYILTAENSGIYISELSILN